MALTCDSKSNGPTRHGSRLRSLLPKVLLYDNVSLGQKLDREVTYIAIEERRAAYTWEQIQRRFITDQAMKEEVHGMNLFPQINHTKQSNQQLQRLSIDFPQRSRTMIGCTVTIPPICSPTTEVAKVNGVCDFATEKDNVVTSRPATEKKRRRRTNNPLRDTRYVKLRRSLTELPVSIENHFNIN